MINRKKIIMWFNIYMSKSAKRWLWNAKGFAHQREILTLNRAVKLTND